MPRRACKVCTKCVCMHVTCVKGQPESLCAAELQKALLTGGWMSVSTKESRVRLSPCSQGSAGLELYISGVTHLISNGNPPATSCWQRPLTVHPTMRAWMNSESKCSKRGRQSLSPGVPFPPPPPPPPLPVDYGHCNQVCSCPRRCAGQGRYSKRGFAVTSHVLKLLHCSQLTMYSVVVLCDVHFVP